MFDCVAIGDEIATNIGNKMQCEIRTAASQPSSHIVQLANGKFHTYCIVSVGSYDPTIGKLESNLTMIRNQSVCKVYVWVVPVNLSASQVVNKVANKYYDKTVSITSSNDGIHPTNYNDTVGSIYSVTGN
jgi:hypothetical protein